MYPSVMRRITLLLAFLITVLDIANAVNKDRKILENMIDDFSEFKDLEAFCDDFEQHFGGECLTDLGKNVTEEFLKVITDGTQKEINTFIRTKLMSHDEDLDLTERECKRLMKRAATDSPKRFIKRLQEALDEHGYTLEVKFKRIGNLKAKIKEIVALDSCNLGALASVVGKYYSPMINLRHTYRRVKDAAYNTIGRGDCDSWDCHTEL